MKAVCWVGWLGWASSGRDREGVGWGDGWIIRSHKKDF